MYFDFEDYRPDIAPVGRAISWREGVLLSIIVHLLMVIVLLLSPRLFPVRSEAAARARAAAARQQRSASSRGSCSCSRASIGRRRSRRDAPSRRITIAMARVARARREPTNPLPFSRGNTPERVEELAARGGARPRARARPGGRPAGARQPPPEPTAPKLPESPSALQLPTAQPPRRQSGANGRSRAGRRIARRRAAQPAALRPERDQFDNPQGGGGQFGPAIQFDTKGVEFGPWIRRFIAQVKRNWLIPYAAMSMKGHVVITFNVHKDGTITDLRSSARRRSTRSTTRRSARWRRSNPTQPLPPEYPADKAFFTVTFFYNEDAATVSRRDRSSSVS